MQDLRRRFESTIQLKEAILQEWEALPHTIDGFRSRVRLVIAENGQYIEKYWMNEQSLTICAELIFMQLQFMILTI